MAAEATKKPICCTPGCKRPARARGLCASCFQAARRMVTRNEITWKALEEQGLAKKLRGRFTVPIHKALRKLKVNGTK